MGCFTMLWGSPERNFMITKANRYGECFDSVTLKKKVGGKYVGAFGAFREGERITFKLTLPRGIGASGAVLRLTPDGGAPKDHPFEVSEHGLTEEYTLTLRPRFHTKLLLPYSPHLSLSQKNYNQLSYLHYYYL